MKVEFYRRNLPHYIVPGFPYFVCINLIGTMPKTKIIEILTDGSPMERLRILPVLAAAGISVGEIILRPDPKRIIQKIQAEFLGPRWLAIPKVADAVKEAILHRDGEIYDLFAFSIMPSHVHLLFRLPGDISEEKSSANDEPTDKFQLAKIIGNLKKYTARQANLILGRRGPFWEHESYDHVVRNRKELIRLVRYTLMNPVRAGLAKTPDEYPWNYVNLELVSSQ